MRRALLALALAAPLSATEPASTPAPSPSVAGPRAPALTEETIARVARAWPRLIAFLEHNRAKVQAAEAHAARRTVVAARCRALAAMEAYLAQPIPPEARTQLADYLTVPPERLVADLAAAVAALDELAMTEQVAEVRKHTEGERAQLVRIANDPSLPAEERAQLKEELAALERTEADLATAGEPVPAPALEVARKHRATIEAWLAWRFP